MPNLVGYEVEFVGVPSAVAAARRAWYVACAENGELEASAYHDLAAAHRRSYNAASWGFLRETMARLGMLAEGQAVSEGDDDAMDDGIDWDWRRQRLPTPGIAYFKLLSNSDWIVTPEEIAEALAAYSAVSVRKRDAVQQDAEWREWMSWLCEAARRDGFIVT
jgi:hypothetical protein